VVSYDLSHVQLLLTWCVDHDTLNHFLIYIIAHCRCLNGVPLPEDLLIVAACNPYRPRSEQSKQQGEGAFGGLTTTKKNNNTNKTKHSGIRAALEDLVYRVHPLPESMLDYVYDYGALPADTEMR
jgi:E3 ubiquitin-protein ligase RNF213